MSGTPKEEEQQTPELLYHVYLRVNSGDEASSKAIPDAYVLATYGTLSAAKRAALDAIKDLGYSADDFDTYQERPKEAEQWEHGDGVSVYAKAPRGQEFIVGIDTKPNTGDLKATPDGSLILPHGADHLHYILQTMVNYNTDRKANTEIEGAYVRRNDAIEAARMCLLDEEQTEADFEQFDTRESLNLKTEADWPFGENVLVHAIKPTGENYFVSVGTPPEASIKHGKKEKK
jgi:hypothetical protein